MNDDVMNTRASAGVFSEVRMYDSWEWVVARSVKNCGERIWRVSN